MTVVGTIARETDPSAIAAWREERRKIVSGAFAPKSRLTLSQWADEYRYLPDDIGGGKWRTDMVPYLRGPMNAITDPRVRRVSVMKSARIGATQGLVVNTIGYCIHQDPTPIIVGLPTIGDAQKFSTSLLQPTIDVTPVLAERIVINRSARKRSTMLEKSYPGGTLHIVGTQSPRALRMVHGRYIFKSEIDAWEGSAGDDGDPYNLIDKRAGAYGSPKFVEESTPLVRETSRIEPAFNSGTKEFFHVPCPHCGELQRLVWGGPDVNFGIKWDRNSDGSPKCDTAHYVCFSGCPIEESFKHRMIRDGASESNDGWVATHPERSQHRSFHLNSLVSPFDGARWSILVEEWYKTERKPEKLRVFVNTFLGETFVEEGQQADTDSLSARRDEGDVIGYEDEAETIPVREQWYDENGVVKVPVGAAVLTRSVDTQDDRWETAVWAWGAGEECWLVDFEIIPGDPELKDTWDALGEIRRKTYRHAGGRELLPRVTFMDAGGHKSKAVNAYARAHRNEKVFSTFGATLQRAPILGNATRNNRAKVQQYPIGSFAAKEALIARLMKILKPGPGYIHLPPWLEDEQLAQLTAEKLIVMGDNRVFKKTRARNELTDLWVMGLAALHQPKPSIVGKLGRMAKRLMEDAKPHRRAVVADETPRAGLATPSDDPPTPARRRRGRPGGGGFVNSWKR